MDRGVQMTTAGVKDMHVSCITIFPTGHRRDPVNFDSLQDALDLARITKRVIWATVQDQNDSVYRIYPGGRVEQRPLAKASLTGD